MILKVKILESFLVTINDVNLLTNKPNINLSKGMVNELLTVEDYEEVIAGDKLSVIEFTSSACPPWACIRSELDTMCKKQEYQDVNVCTIDVEKNPTPHMKAGIETTPTYQFYRKGSKLDQLDGANYDEIVEMIAKHQENDLNII